MSELASRQMLLLSLQRALLGEVPASLRQASIEADPVLQVVRLRFEYAQRDEDGQAGCSCAATEVIADFPAPWTLDEQHVVAAPSTPLAPLANVAYRRAEPAYAETVRCEGSADEGLVFIKVVAMPHEAPVEFDLAQARAFADKLLEAIETVASGWAGGR